MPLVSDRCICLRKFEYSETSQILTLFSRRQGIFRAIAKGAHRRTKAGAGKFDGGIDLLDVGHAVFIHDPTKDLGTLTEWSLAEGHLPLRTHLRAMRLGLYAAELTGLLIEEHDPHPEVFDALESALTQIPGPGREEAFLAFELALLLQAGYMPEWSACVECGRVIGTRDPVRFSPSRGGIVCDRCAPALPDAAPFDPRLARLVRGLLAPPVGDGPVRLPRLTRHQTDPINRLLGDHIEHTLGRPTRMRPWIA